MEQSDAELVRRCLQGDNTSYDLLVKKYQKRVYVFCYRMLGNSEESADAAQDSFIKAYHALDRFRQDAQFLSWLLRIANNTCVDRMRARARRPSQALDELSDDRDSILSEGVSPEELLMKSESDRVICEAVSNLPEKYRASIVLFHYNGLSIQEISRTLEKPEGTIKSNLHVGRELLRRQLEGVLTET